MGNSLVELIEDMSSTPLMSQVGQRSSRKQYIFKNHLTHLDKCQKNPSRTSMIIQTYLDA